MTGVRTLFRMLSNYRQQGVIPPGPPPPPPPDPSLSFVNGLWGTDPAFFPITVWDQSPQFHAQDYANIGVNIFNGLANTPVNADLAALASAGLLLICGQQSTCLGTFPSYSATYAGWQVYDEPDNSQDGIGGPCMSSTIIINTYNSFKAADPVRPVAVNFGEAVANPALPDRGNVCFMQNQGGGQYTYSSYAQGADIVSFDCYPINNHQPITYVADGVDNLKTWVGTSKPIWAFIETERQLTNNGTPTTAQVKCEVWLALTHGASGIQYFCHVFTPSEDDSALLTDATMSAAVHAINTQITSLAAVLNSATIPSGATVSAGGSRIDQMVKRSGGNTYLFAASPNSATVSATFTVAGQGNGTVTVIDESRTIAMTGGVFTDSFAGYGVHLYRM